MEIRPQNYREDKIMLFDLDIRGHHASYIEHLITYWHNHNLSGSLDILIVSEFVNQHSSVVKAAESSPNINFITITSEEEANLTTVNSPLERFQRSFQEWCLINKYTKILKIDHCLLMFFDSLLWRASFGISPPCSMSGIFFRPISHYSSFPSYQPSLQEYFWKFREKLGLSRILASGFFDNLFSLDLLAIDYLSKHYSSITNFVYLPEPIQTHTSYPQEKENIEQDLGIEAGRKVFLLFGSLDRRKGIKQLLEAINLLSDKLNQKLCLLLIGPIEESEKDDLSLLVKDLSQSLPVQIICRDEFIVERFIHRYFEIADVALAPYQRHVGMSAILARAAAAKRPVLSSDYGLMGEITRSFKLGITVNSAIPQNIADGLALYLTEPVENRCDYKKMEEFARLNNAEEFARIIFQNIVT